MVGVSAPKRKVLHVAPQGWTITLLPRYSTHLFFDRATGQTDQMTDFEQLQKLVGPEVKDWSDAKRQEANDNLQQYVALVLRVVERLELDPEANTLFESFDRASKGPYDE